MLKYGQEQDNVFEIIEKGNFFTPTKGENESAPGTIEKGSAHDRMVKALKTAALVLGIIGFVVLGYVVLSDFLSVT